MVNSSYQIGILPLHTVKVGDARLKMNASGLDGGASQSRDQSFAAEKTTSHHTGIASSTPKKIGVCLAFVTPVVLHPGP